MWAPGHQVRLIALSVASLWESAPPGNPKKKAHVHCSAPVHHASSEYAWCSPMPPNLYELLLLKEHVNVYCEHAA